MKLKLITLTAIGAVSLGSAVFAQEPQEGQNQRGGRAGGHRHNSLEQMTENLNLTAEQKAKIQPIIDQARPQMENIRREAMQKTKAIMDNAKAQIRPMLTPEQQKRLDEAKNDRRGGREGHPGGRHRGGGQGGQGEQDDPGDQ